MTEVDQLNESTAEGFVPSGVDLDLYHPTSRTHFCPFNVPSISYRQCGEEANQN